MSETGRQNDRLITAAEVARIYGVAEKTVWPWLKANRIPQPQIRRPGYVRWLLSAIMDDIHTAKVEETEQAST
jgi:predicted DNA-binding transcriptional regulator AlpA